MLISFFREIFRTFRKLKHAYVPLVEVHIDRRALISNLKQFQKLSRYEIAPVLKSNAYGHGLVEVAKVLESQSVPFLIVDTYYEALTLRNEKIKKNILVIGFTRTENILANTLKDVVFTITSEQQLKELVICVKKPTRFHVKIDTGMRRQGIIIDDEHIAEGRMSGKDFLFLLKQNSNCIFEGVCSHLGQPDSEGTNKTLQQITEWNKIVNLMRKSLPSIIHLHVEATGGILLAAEHEDKNIIMTMARLGIGLYGVHESELRVPDLAPVLSMYSIVSSVKTILPGESVGYGFTFTAEKQMRIATIPVGYFEGINRTFSNKGLVYIGESACPIIGRVSMNITSIDVSHLESVSIGDKVEIISNDKTHKNSIIELSKTSGLIPYELLVNIPQKLKRIIV